MCAQESLSCAQEPVTAYVNALLAVTRFLLVRVLKFPQGRLRLPSCSSTAKPLLLRRQLGANGKMHAEGNGSIGRDRVVLPLPKG